MVVLLTVLLAASETPLRVRASAEAAPCVAAVAKAYGRAVSVETGALRNGAAADVLVGSAVEISRALEGGAAVVGSEESVARIPWVLSVAAGTPDRPNDLAELGRRDVEVVVLAGPQAHEVRKVLAAGGPARVRESQDPAVLRGAPLAVVPLSLAGPGERVAVDIRPLSVGAAVTVRTAHPEAARAFVSFLVSQAGQTVFAACGEPAPPAP